MNKKYCLLILGIALLLGFVCIAQDIVIEPQEVLLSLTGGESASGQIAISNNTDKAMTIVFVPEDLVRRPGDENIWGMTRWMTLEPSDPPRIQIPPNGKAFINYKVDIPEGVEGPHWARLRFILVTQVNRKEVYRPLPMTCLIRQVDPNNLVHGALLTDIGLQETPENGIFFVLYVQKTGTGFNKYTGEITIISQSRGQIDALPVPEFGVLPLQPGQVVVPWDGELPPDIYKIVGKVFLDEELIALGSFTFKKRE